MTVKLEIINGVEGPCLSLNDYRIAGPKPWGGGSISKTFNVDLEDVNTALHDLGYEIIAIPATQQGEKTNAD